MQGVHQRATHTLPPPASSACQCHTPGSLRYAWAASGVRGGLGGSPVKSVSSCATCTRAAASSGPRRLIRKEVMAHHAPAGGAGT
ncbi:hypothetical protein AUC44_13860 [Deinococcus actinosclerus]|uniref:Uncharacterized protein n=1 Tax=Deinococcus actinosclerus TaxID=1768108 RepID=A0ABM5X7P9_9DEIO|nr:hypothetical protein AUC44_13860 [Deinococcus actinosclerus]